MDEIVVGGRRLGPLHACFVAAEIGINHNGDLDLARQMIDAAARSGADAVKFQNYRTEDFISDRTLTYRYVSRGQAVEESQYDLFKRCELSPRALGELKTHCDRAGVVFFSTPTGEDGLRELLEAGAPLVKNGSDYLGNLRLIRAMARTGVPTVLSTGMATLAEMDDAVRAYRDAGGRDLVLLHCVSAYPAPPADVNLRRLPALSASFGCPVGFSDHTAGIVAAVGAVALGACFVEKHFTLDRDLPGPDQRFSSDPAELRALVSAVRELEASLGRSAVGPAPSELSGRRDFRLSCVAAHDLPAGHVLAEADIAFRRPGTGLPPRAAEWLVGLRVKRAHAGGDPLHLDGLEA
jgi:sialic acid synthase SpsE